MTTMRGKTWTCLVGIVGSVALFGLPASRVLAQQHGHEHDYHGQDYHHFGLEDRARWQGGQWRHDWHDGRFAWWWTVDGLWYFYPVPIYPYPTYVPPAIVVQQAPPVPSGQPPAQYWYYCDNPAGYYPYVASCNSGWRPVPAVPPPSPK
jgi:hypothetical protein